MLIRRIITRGALDAVLVPVVAPLATVLLVLCIVLRVVVPPALSTIRYSRYGCEVPVPAVLLVSAIRYSYEEIPTCRGKEASKTQEKPTVSGIVHTPAHWRGGFAIWPNTHPALGNTPPEVEGANQPIVLQSGPNSPPWDQ